jgi:septation ring formation regulator EzrA
MAELTVEVFGEKMDSFAKIVKEGFDSVDEQFKTFRKDVDERFDTIDERFKGIDERFDVQTSVTNERFAEVREEFKNVNERIDGLYTKIDGFIALHQKLDVELVAMRDKYNRVAKAHNALAAITAPTAGVRV